MVVPMYPTYFCKRVNFLCFYFSCYSVHVYHLMLSGNFNGSQNWDGIIRVFFLGGGDFVGSPRDFVGFDFSPYLIIPVPIS